MNTTLTIELDEASRLISVATEQHGKPAALGSHDDAAIAAFGGERQLRTALAQLLDRSRFENVKLTADLASAHKDGGLVAADNERLTVDNKSLKDENVRYAERACAAEASLVELKKTQPPGYWKSAYDTAMQECSRHAQKVREWTAEASRLALVADQAVKDMKEARRGCADLAARNRQLQACCDRLEVVRQDVLRQRDAAQKAGFAAVAKGASDAELVRVLRADYASLQQRNEALSSNIQAYSRSDAKLREEKRQLQDQLAKSAEAKGALEANAIKLRQVLTEVISKFEVSGAIGSNLRRSAYIHAETVERWQKIAGVKPGTAGRLSIDEAMKSAGFVATADNPARYVPQPAPKTEGITLNPMTGPAF